MMGARGVALGLGKINLNDLNNLPLAERRAAQHAIEQQRKMEDEQNKVNKPKVVIKKHVDRQTLWAACRAVVFGCVLIVLGTAMTVLGYFSEQLSTITTHNSTSNETLFSLDTSKKVQFDSLAFIGPVVMGVGAFILMIACVMTLESRDKHAQIVHEFPPDVQRRSTRRSRRAPTALDGEQPEAKQHSGNDGDDENTPLKDAEPPSHPNRAATGDNQRSHNNNNHGGTTNEPRFQTGHPDLVNPGVYNNNRPLGAAVLNALGGSDSAAPSQGTTNVTLLSKSIMESELGKYPSTSCIDTLVNRTDPRALLQRFLEDQSRMVNRMRRREAANLYKQSNSLEVQGSDLEQIPHRPTKSEEMPIMHSIIAEVHNPPATTVPPPSAAPTATTASTTAAESESDGEEVRLPQTATVKRARRPGAGRPAPTGEAPLVRPESILDVHTIPTAVDNTVSGVAAALDSDADYCSPMSLTPDGRTSIPIRVDTSSNYSVNGGRISDASYVTVAEQFIGESANDALTTLNHQHPPPSLSPTASTIVLSDSATKSTRFPTTHRSDTLTATNTTDDGLPQTLKLNGNCAPSAIATAVSSDTDHDTISATHLSNQLPAHYNRMVDDNRLV